MVSYPPRSCVLEYFPGKMPTAPNEDVERELKLTLFDGIEYRCFFCFNSFSFHEN